MPRRTNGPKWYASRRSYYVTLNGVLHNLGPNPAQANRRYAELTLQAPTLRSDSTVQDLVSSYLLAKEPDWKPKTLRTRRWVLTKFCESYGLTHAALLIPYHLTLFRQSKPTWGPGTVRALLESLSGCYQWGVQQGLLAENPIRHVKKPPSTKRGDNCYITEEQRQALLAASHPSLKVVLEALWHTGQRPGAVLTVEANEVQGDRWVMGPKAGRKVKSLTVHLNAPMMVITEQQLALHPEGPLFRTEHGKPWTYNCFEQAFQTARKKAEVSHVTPYWYRHTFGRRALDAGVEEGDLALLMNTSIAMIERVYGHRATLQNRLRESLRRVSLR